VTKSLSNLVRRGMIVNKDERVIDYNDLIQKKILAVKEKMQRKDEDGFVNGLDAKEVELPDYDALFEDADEYADLTADIDEELLRLDQMEERGFGPDVSDEEKEAISITRANRREQLMQQKAEILMEAKGINLSADNGSEQVSKLNSESNGEFNSELANQKAEQIIEEANQRASLIIDEANNEANEIISNANAQIEEIRQDAKNAGYNEGLNSANEEIENLKANLENEYEQKLSSLEAEYEEKKANIEPELVEILTDVFKKVTLTVAEDNHEIIMHLINGVMRNADSSYNFIIKVSPDDYKFLINNQGKLYVAMSKEVNIDILEDPTMKRNECIIETDTGVFNCGLDIELDNLIKDLKLLSCV